MNETDKLLEEVMQDPMYQPYVTISWCPIDIKSIREDWSDEKCMEALDNIVGMLEDRSIELGWEVIESLLDYYEYSEDALDNDDQL